MTEEKNESTKAVFVVDNGPPSVTVVSATNLGPLTGTPNNVIARDVAATGMLGGKLLWAFGDTFINNLPVNATPADWRSSTQAHSTLADPFSLTELEDSRGVPFQLIPYTQAELNYNIEKNNGSDRIALWPSAVLSTDENNAEIVYMKIHVLGSLNYQMIGTGIAHIAISQDQATRDFSLDSVSGLTFSGDVRPFGSSGARLVSDSTHDTAYLYSCTNDIADNCYVARVCAHHCSTNSTWKELLVDPANYQTWNGSTWVSDLSQAKPMAHLQASGVGWSVAWNPHLRNPDTGKHGTFIGLYNEIVAFGDGTLPTNKVMLVTAANPWGPWSDPVLAFTLTPEAKHFDYAVQLHPELTSDHGTTIYVTYAHPTGPFRESVNGVQLKLKNT